MFHNMHLFVNSQYSILFEPSLLFLSRSDYSLSSDTSWPHRQTTYVFLSGTGHSSLHGDKFHTTNHFYTSVHNFHYRLYLLLKIFVHYDVPLNLLKI